MKTQFNCPHCNRLLAVEGNALGTQFECPACATLVMPPVTLPITITASPRALFAKYIRRGLALCLIWMAWIWFSARLVASGAGSTFVAGTFIVLVAVSLLASVDVTLAYLRIRHTRYTIYRNKIEASSYLFRWLGTNNTTINLTQLRQIQSFTNSYLDLWFFHCGTVVMTVSGDISDVELTNLHQPNRVKQLIEQIAFEGSSDASVQ